LRYPSTMTALDCGLFQYRTSHMARDAMLCHKYTSVTRKPRQYLGTLLDSKTTAVIQASRMACSMSSHPVSFLAIIKGSNTSPSSFIRAFCSGRAIRYRLPPIFDGAVKRFSGRRRGNLIGISYRCLIALTKQLRY
jgi:hypothetical protein